MKKLSVILKLEMEIPDDWEIDTTSDGIEILRMGDGRYLDLCLEPVCLDDKEENRRGHLDEDLLKLILLMVKGISTELKVEDQAIRLSPLPDLHH
jgi:hypothetical protein